VKASLFAAACLLLLPLASGCNTSDPTSAVLVNQYPVSSKAGSSDSVVVYKGWWAVAQFADPVAPGSESDPVRVVQGTDYAYALLAPGWDPASGAPPSTLIPVRSSQRLSVARGDTLSFVVSDTTTDGDCAAGKPLSQEDANFITQRTFPNEFENAVYDAATCTRSALPGDAGGTAGSGGEAGTGGN